MSRKGSRPVWDHLHHIPSLPVKSLPSVTNSSLVIKGLAGLVERIIGRDAKNQTAPLFKLVPFAGLHESHVYPHLQTCRLLRNKHPTPCSTTRAGTPLLDFPGLLNERFPRGRTRRVASPVGPDVDILSLNQ